MSFLDKSLGHGPGWIGLVGGRASLASGAILDLGARTALLLIGLGRQAITALSGRSGRSYQKRAAFAA